jgi:membrane associated rhomboid family serine protease
MLGGALIAFGVIALFVFTVDEPHPSWPENWRLRPLIITPLAGAAGAVAAYLFQLLLSKSGWIRILIVFLSILGFLIALWMGIVLGLDGTLWN